MNSLLEVASGASNDSEAVKIPVGQESRGFEVSLDPPPIALLGIPFDNVTLTEALARITGMIESGRPHYIVTANLDFLYQTRNDSELRNILLDAHLVIGDGMPLVWASRLLGNPLPERVAGADLVPHLIRIASRKAYRLFFLGASAGANCRAVKNTREKFPDVKIVGHYSPPFRSESEMNDAEIIRRVQQAKPDILLIAFGCPKAEKWIARHYRSLGVPVMIGVGATIDFLAGRRRRAPAWMQGSGLEWLFRLAQEPRRLFHRYRTDFQYFAGGLTEQWWRAGAGFSPRRPCVAGCAATSQGSWLQITTPERFDRDAVRRDLPLWRRARHFHCAFHLHNTQFMDSTGAALLLHVRKQLRFASKDMVLVAPRRPVVQLLKFMRVHESFCVCEKAPADLHEQSVQPPEGIAPHHRLFENRLSDQIREPVAKSA